MNEGIIKETEIFCKSYYDRLEADNENSDYWKNHIGLGRKYALKLAKIEKGDLFIVEIAILLHDIGKIDGRKNHADKSEKIAREFLRKFNIENDKLKLILQCIKKHSSKYAKENNELEVKVIQSADALSVLFDDAWQEYTRKKLEKEEIFFILDKTYDKINLDSAKKIAKPRIKYLKSLI